MSASEKTTHQCRSIPHRVVRATTTPVTSAPTAKGTMAYQPTSSIAIHAPRTVSASPLVRAAIPRATYATTAPIQPTENDRWTASISFRTPGTIAIVSPPKA